MATATRCRALVAGFGHPGMRDLDFGRQLVRYLESLHWPDGVVVEELPCAAPLVLHRMQELAPPKVVLVGANFRGTGRPGEIRLYRLDRTPPAPDVVHRRVGESMQGVVDLDHTIALALHWGGLPEDTVVLEVEPADCSFGIGFTDELAESIDELVDLLRDEVGGDATIDLAELDTIPSAGDPLLPPPAPAPPTEKTPACDGLTELATRAREHAQRLQAPDRPRSPLVEEALARVGVEVAGRSQPWGIKLAGGSDWSEVVPLPDGWVGVIMGDAAGRGIEAAAAMEELRAASRAYAVVEANRPARVVGHLDRLVRATGMGEGTTLVYLAVHPATGAVRLSNAGHCPPLVVPVDGRPRFLTGGRAEPLGTLTATSRPEASHVVPPGATVVVVTDGLVRSASRDLREGLARLRDAAGAAPRPVDQLCEHLLTACADGLARDDDLSLLAVRLPVTAAPAGGRTRAGSPAGGLRRPAPPGGPSRP